jgi:hypothetical protein
MRTPGDARDDRFTMPRPSYVHLLEVDPALGSGLEQDALEDARRLAIAPLVTIPRGTWSTGELAQHIGRPCRFGCLVVDGLIAHELVLQGRPATQLLGKGDLLIPAPETRIASRFAYFGVSDSASVAVLDALPALARRWPAIAIGLFLRAQRQAERAALQHAIGHLRRAEDRILALFWLLGDRWGLSVDERLFIPLALGHEAIAQLVGGRRSTITAALGRLAGEGLLVRETDGTWTLPAGGTPATDPPERPPRNPEARLITRGGPPRAFAS